MAFPALRKPKLMETTTPIENTKKRECLDINYVILTLTDDSKLVIESDAYHGILSEEGSYRCVFCDLAMEMDGQFKELHKDSLEHRARMFDIPYIEEFPEHLLRKLNKHESYCTTCHVTIPTYSLSRHITNNAHVEELEKAMTRAIAYKPNLGNDMCFV